MKLDKDKIIFESREEIEQVYKALKTNSKIEQDKDDFKSVKRLCDLLDLMHLNW